MRKYFLGFLVIFILVCGAIIGSIAMSPNRQIASVVAVTQSPFHYNFQVDGVLNESGKIDDSSSPYFWLNSGGQFFLEEGVGKTVQGKLGQFNKWRLAYAVSDPTDTDSGFYPQNIFRLVTKSKWADFRQEAYFKIVEYNLSQSKNRGESNGLLLFNRYQDGNNLYYTGVRVDGAAVIKKKIKGEYYTMAYEKIFEGEYSRESNPNLLPENIWLGLRSEIITNPDNTVSIKLFIDKEKTGNWILVAEAKDDGKSYGGSTILNEGYAGIRTDFMDAEFDDYKIKKF